MSEADFIWGTLLASALMTIPRLDREPLMAVISLNRSPCDWLFSMRSLPARSTRHKVAAWKTPSTTLADQSGDTTGPLGRFHSHLHLRSLPLLRPWMSSWNTECEREERSFWAVWAVERFWLAKAIRPRTWQADGWQRWVSSSQLPGSVVLELNVWPYLVLVGDLQVCEVGDGHLVVGGLSDLMLGPFAGFASIKEVAKRLVVNLHEAGGKIELRKTEELLGET